MEDYKELSIGEIELKKELEKYILGQTIKEIKDKETLVLSNGVSLKVFEKEGSCCSSSYGSFEWLHYKDIKDFQAAITALDVEIEDDEYGYSTALKVVMLHNGEEIAELDGVSETRSAYYFTALSLYVSGVSYRDSNEIDLISC